MIVAIVLVPLGLHDVSPVLAVPSRPMVDSLMG
jgi:hypothetical protein